MARPTPFGWKNLPTGTPAAPGVPAPAAAGKPRRWRRLAIAGLIVGALSGLTVLVVLMLAWSDYPNLVIVAPRAPSSLAVPGNDAGGTTARALADFCQAGKDRPHLNAEPISDPKDRDGWKRNLKAARGGGIALYVSASGAADANGPFLWWPPAEATATLADGDKLRVSELLAELKSRSGPKLLVIDLVPGALPWAANGANPDFARAIKDIDADIHAVPDLVVICSADADELPWGWDAARSTVFGYHFANALQGAGLSGNDLVTALTAFAHVEKEVSVWAKKRRAASQTPILLPAADGKERAAAMTLAKVPPGGPPAVSPPSAPTQYRTSLEREWASAEKELKNAERFDPETYKQYLGWLLRWEQSVRDGTVTDTAPNPVADRRERLARAAVGDVPLVSLAVPQPPADTGKLDIDLLWKAADAAALRGEWKLQTGEAGARPEHVRRASELLLDKLDLVGYSRPNIEKAVRLLDEIEAGQGQRPVETHILRMFARHLDARTPPDPEIVKSAIAARRLAERVTWASGDFPEQAFRWTRGLLAEADRERQRGEDLLFAGDADSHKEAAKLLAKASELYRKAKDIADAVSAALAVRDRVFARLPVYARWVADGHRTTLRDTPAEIDQLVQEVKKAALAAHELNRLLAAPPADPTKLDEAVAALATDAATVPFDKVLAAHERSVTTLLDAAESQPENWHALDAAVAVPFLSADRRIKLFDKLDRITRYLDRGDETLGGAAKPFDGRLRAYRHAECARALLGVGSPDLPPTVETSEPRLFREVADKIGQRFREFPDAARADGLKVASADPLANAEQPVADAARRTRLADPSAPVVVAVDPVLAERRYWRHRFLLWQAERAIADGWADVGAVTPVSAPNQTVATAGWYSKKTADGLIALARVAVSGVVATPTAEQSRRLTADCDAASDRAPNVVLPFAAKGYTIIKDYPRWGFGFEVNVEKPQGFPTLWIDLPEGYRAANPDESGKREAYRGGGKSAVRSYRTPEQAAGGKQDLVSTVLYRGHTAQWRTPLAFTGDPTIEYVHVPPVADPRMAILADERAISGAVVILVDRSASMRWDENSKERSPTRTSLALKGLEKLLEALPAGTHVTVGGFQLNGDTPVVEPIAGPVELDVTDRWKALKLTPAKLDAIPRAETPIAWSVEEVLHKDRGKRFWPEGFAGARSLVVLTDGEDNYDEKRNEKAAATILRAVTAKDHDTRVHLVFFAMDDKDEKGAKAQFESLERPEQYGPGKLPVKLWPGVRNGDEFAAKLRDQFRPRVVYARVGDPTARSGLLTATLGGKGTGESQPSPPLKAGEYLLKSGQWEGRAWLNPGDQLLLKVAKPPRGGNDLGIPPTAFDLTNPAYRKQGGAENPLKLSVPRAGLDGTAAGLTVALERAGPTGEKQKRMNRPLFPWLDVVNPAKPGVLPRMRVTNDANIAAPAWTVRLGGWDLSGDQTAPVKMPAVTGFWMDARTLDKASPLSSGSVRPNTVLEVPSEPAKGVSVRKIPTEKGPLLILEVDYEEPGRLPYLFATWGDATPPEQRHAYYDPQHRYTATFGPLTPDLENRIIAFKLYSVADLRKEADSALVELPAMKSTDKPYDATTNLRFSPPK